MIILLTLGISFWISKKGIFHQPTILPLTHSWDTIIPNQQVPDGIPSLNAKSCGICHTEIYKEWKESTHAHAWTDVQYQAELKKNKDLFVCKNCHLPVQNQQRKITTGLYDGDYYRPVEKDNPHFDASLQQEGITCVACHMNNNTIIGSHEDINPAHLVKVDADYLSEKLCISCHDAQEKLSDNLICSFETGQEWRAGPFSKQGKNCISCHMPTIERPSVVGAISRKGHSHYFPASGIPKSSSHHPKRLESLTYQIIKPKHSDKNKITLGLRLTNKFAGHKVPTGDPERHYFIRLDLLDTHQQIVQSDTFRIGEEWQWYPTAKKLSDNNLRPGESRDFIQSLPRKSSEGLRWKVTVTKHRMTPEIKAFHHLTDYPLSITVFEHEAYLSEIYPID